MGDSSEENCEKSAREFEMEEFRQNLREKREQRQTLLSNFRKKFAKLECENSKLRNIIESAGLKVDFDDELDAKSADLCTTSSTIVAPPDDSDHQQDDCDDDDDHVTSIKTNLAETQHELQLANANVLSLTSELSAIKRQVVSLKEVNTISKQLMEIRETEVNQLRAKLRDIEESIADREMVIMSENLRNEYIRQLDNMKNLKMLYEQRARASDLEMETLKERLIASENRLKEQDDKNQEQENHIHQLENDLSITQNQLVDSKCEIETIQTEYGAINQLFGRMLMGFNSGNDNLDIDKLTEILEEHRLLLSNITNNEESLIANNFLPKVLYDLVTQATEKDNETENDEKTVENSSCSSVDRREISSTEEIIGNLPKVWRILTELLSHQKKINPVPLQEDGQSEDCYKSVQTPSGPQLVLSVSKTYIKLKNLILEKKSLTKETNRLKTLNSHLERTLESQEKRLGVVSVELTKTWHLVNRLQRQHRQLHTQEQVLRYQLQQKRRLLLELKEELEYCRVKWAKAREKNEDSEVQWESLRRDFASRKDGSASAESGYSDEPVSEEDDDEDDGKSAGDVDSDEEIEKIPTIAQVKDKKNPSHETLEEMFNRISASVQENPPKIAGNTSLRATTPPENNLENIAANVENTVTSTSTASTSVLSENEEDYTARRAARLKRLEEECKTFMAKMTENRNRGSQLCNHLDRVHTRFGDNLNVEENANESNPTPDATTTTPTPPNSETTTRRTTQLEHHEGECKSLVAAQMSVIECNLEQVNNSTDLTTNPQGGILTATEENYTSRRSERIQRLEAQCRELMDKMTANRNRGEELSDQLDEMHQRFTSRSSSEAPSSQSPDPPENDPESTEKEEDPRENFP